MLIAACSSPTRDEARVESVEPAPPPSEPPPVEAPPVEAPPDPPAPAATAAPVVMELQIFGSRYRGSPSCFRWIGDLRGRTYENQPNAIDVELSSGHRMSIPYVANEADTYVSACVPIARLGTDERISARFRAQLGESAIDETLEFARETPADDSFVNIAGTPAHRADE
jgi:hypothetical protein